MLRAMLIGGLLVLLVCVSVARGADDVKVTPDVVYGHKFGLAMTLDVYRPTENANGAGVIFMVSGGWYSQWAPPEKLQPLFQPLLDAGFTVFSVRHGSSPKFSIPEAVSDVRRGVRYIRANADEFGIDPDRIGVFGMSAGGHLSLVLGTTGDDGVEDKEDPLSSTSDRVQAVVAYVAPTDLRIMVRDAEGRLPAYERFPALDLDLEEAAKYSPLIHVTHDDAPTLLIVGKKDELVPMQHSENILKELQDKQVPADLAVFEDSDHGLRAADAQEAMKRQVAWFQKYLAKQEDAQN